jgi:hypothetical protein
MQRGALLCSLGAYDHETIKRAQQVHSPVGIGVDIADCAVACSGAIEPRPLLRVDVQADAQVVVHLQAAGGLRVPGLCHQRAWLTEGH